MGLSDFQPLNANSYLCTITLGVVAYLCIRDKKKKIIWWCKKGMGLLRGPEVGKVIG